MLLNKKFLSWPPPPLLHNDFLFLSRVLNSPESDAQYTYNCRPLLYSSFWGQPGCGTNPLTSNLFSGKHAYVAFQEVGFLLRFHDTLYFVNTTCCGVFRVRVIDKNGCARV